MATESTSPDAHPSPILVSELADDPDMGQIINKFLSNLGPKVTNMADYLSTNRLDELARLAHQLKGAGGGYGFPTISTAAQKVEQFVHTDQALDEIQTAVNELSSLCRNAIASRTDVDPAPRVIVERGALTRPKVDRRSPCTACFLVRTYRQQLPAGGTMT